MTVAELIVKLSEFDPDLPVYIYRYIQGWTTPEPEVQQAFYLSARNTDHPDANTKVVL